MKGASLGTVEKGVVPGFSHGIGNAVPVSALDRRLVGVVW